MVRLELPSASFAASFRAAVDEFQQEGRYQELEYDLPLLRRDFPAFIERVDGYRRGEGLPSGFVPLTDYWLIDQDEFIGRLSIRHSLTPWLALAGGHIGYEIRPSMRRRGYGRQILALGLPKARALGLERVLVTCQETNIGSRKIIEANGGVLENAVQLQDGEPRVLRYWIALS
jgi:predicted acetyltransferase